MARGGGLRAKKGDVHCAAWPTDLKKPLIPSGKQAFLQNRSFASKDGWDRVLRPLVDVLGPLRRGQGEWVHSSGGHLGPLGGSGSTHLVSIVWMTGGLGGHEPEGLTRPGPLARRILVAQESTRGGMNYKG